MPTLDPNQPSLTGPTESSNFGLRRFIHSTLGLAAAGAFLLVVWPGLLVYFAPGIHLERFGGATQFRFLAFLVFAIVMALRFRLNPGKRPSRTSIAWSEFANEVGGTLTQGRRKPTAAGWEGGPTVRWDTRGVTITLTGCTDTSRYVHTRFRADIRLARAFQFHVMPETMLTKAVLSAPVWNVVLAGVKAEAGRGNGNDPQALSAERMAFMAEKDILIGDPLFDDAFLVKSDNAQLALEFFSDAGVSHWLRELNARHKGWHLSLVIANLPDAHQLTLAVPGILLEPQGLESSRQVLDAAVSCFADRGMLAASSPKAA